MNALRGKLQSIIGIYPLPLRERVGRGGIHFHPLPASPVKGEVRR